MKNSFPQRELVLSLVCVVGIVLCSCKDNNSQYSGEAVARYKQAYLYQGELNYYIPAGLSAQDSIRLAKKYIEDWLTARALEDKAHTVLPDIDQQVTGKVAKYRSRLIEHEYMNHVVNNELYAEISNNEIADYYESHQDRFTSQADFYSFFYVKSPEAFEPRMISAIRSKEKNRLDELAAWCSKQEEVEFKLDSTYATDTELELIGKGLPLNVKKIPINQVYVYDYADPETGKITHHMLKMLGKVAEGERRPMFMCREEIRGIILNQRKRKLMDQTKTWLLDQAKMNKDVAIY